MIVWKRIDILSWSCDHGHSSAIGSLVTILGGSFKPEASILKRVRLTEEEILEPVQQPDEVPWHTNFLGSSGGVSGGDGERMNLE